MSYKREDGLDLRLVDRMKFCCFLPGKRVTRVTIKIWKDHGILKYKVCSRWSMDKVVKELEDISL
jgi:hypothetical protein